MKKFFAIAAAIVCSMLSVNSTFAQTTNNEYGTILNEENPQEDILKQRMAAFTMITEWTAKQVNTIHTPNARDLREGLSAMVRTSGKSQLAMNHPRKEMKMMSKQIQAGKTFVESADMYLKENNDLALASIRDVVASYCTQNALLLQDDSEIDYWSNVEPQLNTEYRTAYFSISS